jgi:hypothetical protein
LVPFFILTCFFIISLQALVLGDTRIDGGFISTARANEGIVSAQYAFDSRAKVVKVLITFEGKTRLNYPLRPNVETFFPLQLGSGRYQIAIGEVRNGKQFFPIVVDEIVNRSVDEKVMFTISNPQIDYAVSTEAVPAYQAMCDGQVYNDKVDTVYQDLIQSYDYDYDKAQTVASGYIPVLDTIFGVKKGICYDYSALLAGALRSQGIPTKLVMGYAPDVAVYHAWNEIQMADGVWVVVDTTADSTYYKAKMKFNFAKDPSKYQIVNVY